MAPAGQFTIDQIGHRPSASPHTSSVGLAHAQCMQPTWRRWNRDVPPLLPSCVARSQHSANSFGGSVHCPSSRRPRCNRSLARLLAFKSLESVGGALCPCHDEPGTCITRWRKEQKRLSRGSLAFSALSSFSAFRSPSLSPHPTIDQVHRASNPIFPGCTAHAGRAVVSLPAGPSKWLGHLGRLYKTARASYSPLARPTACSSFFLPPTFSAWN